MAKNEINAKTVIQRVLLLYIEDAVAKIRYDKVPNKVCNVHLKISKISNSDRIQTRTNFGCVNYRSDCYLVHRQPSREPSVEAIAV